MKLKSVALAAALAVSSIPALAVSTDLGPLNGDIEGFGNIFTTGAGVFSDTFSFSLGSAMTVSGMTGWSGIGTFGLVLLDSMGDTLDTDTTPGSFSFSLAAGSYALNFVGFGAAPGSFYGGNVSAVPEPEAYALMLAGLGMIGFIAARRRERS
jgi:PEP-CTERM motif